MPMSIFFAYGIEIFIIFALIMWPQFTVKIFIPPILGMIMYIIILAIAIPVSSELNFTNNMYYIINWITVILNIVFNILIMLKIKKNDKLIQLQLTVKRKLPIDYDYSVIIFDGNNGKKYAIQTDLDEKFKEGKVYDIALKNKNISSKATKIQGEEVYSIEKIDASLFLEI